jgi:hypothetical protein
VGSTVGELAGVCDGSRVAARVATDVAVCLGVGEDVEVAGRAVCVGSIVGETGVSAGVAEAAGATGVDAQISSREARAGGS